jgi:hypothetical protein
MTPRYELNKKDGVGTDNTRQNKKNVKHESAVYGNVKQSSTIDRAEKELTVR